MVKRIFIKTTPDIDPFGEAQPFGMDLNCAKPRVNASMLSTLQGRVVTILGMAHSPEQDGMSFQLKSSDDQDVRVFVQEPLQEYIEGLVEVQGKVDNRNGIECLSYVVFSSEQSQGFDMEMYNKALMMTARVPEHYVTMDSPQYSAAS